MSNNVYEKLKRQNLCHKAEEKGVYVDLFQDFFKNTMKGDLSGSHSSVYAQYARFLDVALAHLKQSMKDGSNLELLTLCPCSPETSPLGEVDGGILARYELLKESVPVNGSAVPLNLE